ncbi:MAG: FeoA domain-containing protein [Candidatus Altiarchaeota archaeon]|nr:FeoA domain-containing protein [Candidatus Altiarchaeota archaeon]
MRLLNEVEARTKVTVKRIDGGPDIKKHLGDLGVAEGVELTVLATQAQHEHRGPISLEIAGGEIILAQGMADKIYVGAEDTLMPLLKLEKGDEGTVESIEGGKDFKNWLSELGIDEGTEVRFLRHVPDDTLIFKVDNKEIRLGEGEASKVFAEYGGQFIQINYLREGEKTEITKVIGGVGIREKLRELGVEEGTEIVLTGREERTHIPVRGNYVQAEIGDHLISIGHGMTEKIWVDVG